MTDPTNQPLVQLHRVTKSFPVGGGETLTVLRDLDLEVPAARSLSIVGPSGSGKSTLLNLIGALDRPTTGAVHLAGQDLAALSDRQLAALRNRRIGFVFQLHHLLPACTVLENVLLPVLATAPRVPESAVQRAHALLERVGLQDRLHHRPAQLSGGERQRTAVVRALINQPDLLLADEPTGSLDTHASDALATLLLELNREQNVTLIVATHDTALAARMKTTLALRDGQLHPATSGALQ